MNCSSWDLFFRYFLHCTIWLFLPAIECLITLVLSGGTIGLGVLVVGGGISLRGVLFHGDNPLSLVQLLLFSC